MLLYEIQTEQKSFMNHSEINCHIQFSVLCCSWKLLYVLLILRLIYWVCVAFGSSVRALGFTLSFLPLLVLLGANLYFIGSVRGQEAVFDVAPPTTAPPPKQRWWGWTQRHVQHSEWSLKQMWVWLCCWRPPPSSKTIKQWLKDCGRITQ